MTTTVPGSDQARRLTEWAAGCAERALATLTGQFPDDLGGEAVAAARAWAGGTGTADACREAAFDAQATARDAHDAGYRALAVALRAAANAAASVDDPVLAIDAAALAIESITLNSATCEQESRAAGELRQQWEELPDDLRPSVFPAEPPLPPAAACAIEP